MTDVIVIGGGGLQARAMFEAAARGHDLSSWVAVDRAWNPERRAKLESLGVQTTEADALSDPERLRELIAPARAVANFAGPYYRTGGTVLDACIDVGTDYVDICDDADATLDLLSRDDAAQAAGVRALIGMGSSPGVTNVLTRAAVDALGGAEQVDIGWIVDVKDVSNAAILHFWHIFGLVDRNGERTPVAAFENLSRRQVEFPAPLGERTLLELSHPEPITLPRFLPVQQVQNFGGVAPDDALMVCWALARLGADAEGSLELSRGPETLTDVGIALYDRYAAEREQTTYLGGGLVIDVHTDGNGYRFASGDSMSMEESTGTPAAAGILMMLADETPGSGVFAPECLSPAKFFPTLGRVSRSSGSLNLRRLVDGKPAESLRIRDLIAQAAAR